MIERVIGSVWVAFWLGLLPVAAFQLTPEILVDKYLLEATMLSEEKDYGGALEAMDKIVALQKDHDLALPEAFPFQYAQTALSAGSVQAAIESVKQYLSSAGTEGKYYREALELLVKSERRLREVPDCRLWNTEMYFKAVLVESVTACLAAGADPMARNKDKQTPLHYAAEFNENPAVIKVLLKAGADPMVRDGYTRRPLHNAARVNENPAVIEALLKAGADPMVRDGLTRTPLHYATMSNENPAVIEILLKAGADPMARDMLKKTPLHYAASSNENPAVIKALLKAGADPMVRDEDKQTLLHYAARYTKDPAVIEALLKAGADPMVRGEYKQTPLHNAARVNENPAVIEVLLKAGADPMARNEWKSTPLHYAAEFNENPAVIEVLQKAGADPMARDEDKQTPLHRSEKNKNAAVRQALLAAGAGAASHGSFGNTGATASGGPCQVPGYPTPPGGVANLGFSWCPASVGMQVRAFALQAAGAQCAIATGSSSTPEQIEARRQEIRTVCDRLEALGARNCQCPPGLRP